MQPRDCPFPLVLDNLDSDQGDMVAMSAAGLKPEAEPIAPRSERTREVTLDLLRRSTPPQALVASSGMVLQGVVEAVKDEGGNAAT